MFMISAITTFIASIMRKCNTNKLICSQFWDFNHTCSCPKTEQPVGTSVRGNYETSQ